MKILSYPQRQILGRSCSALYGQSVASRKELTPTPHRNRFEGNRIVDSGGEKGVAIDINGETQSVAVLKNELHETRAPKFRISILIGAETSDIRCEENQIESFAIPISHLRRR